MKVRVSELPVGSCFRQGRTVKKKVDGDRALTVAANGRVRTRKLRGDPEVEPVPCELRHLGAGLRRHPEQVIEIGDGNILRHGRTRR